MIEGLVCSSMYALRISAYTSKFKKKNYCELNFEGCKFTTCKK